MDALPQEGGRWGIVAASVMRRPGLSVAAKATYSALATYADRNGWIWVRQSTLAADLERSRPWVLAALAELESAGLLQHERRFVEGRQRASRYRLLDGITRFPAANDQPDLDVDQDLPDQDLAGLAEQVSDVRDSGVSRPDTNHNEDSSLSLSGAGERETDRNQDFLGKEEESAGSVPLDWVPTAADVIWAKGKHPKLNVLVFTERFVLTCRAKGYRYADPSAAWRRWLIEPKGRLPLLPSPPLPRTADQDSRHDRPANHHTRQHRSSATEFASAGPSLAERNDAHAAATLERIMARRARGATPGHTS
jgi:Helix-turn-helix domain